MSISIGGKTVSEIHIPSTNFVQWKPVEYIQSDGTGQYIGTTVTPTAENGFRLEIGFMPTTNNYGKSFWGLGTVNGVVCSYYYTNYLVTRSWGKDIQVSTPTINVKSNLVWELKYGGTNRFSVNGGTSWQNLTSSTSYGISNPISINRGVGRFYYCKLYDNNVLVRDFVPCVLTSSITADKDSQGTARSSGEIGMWDLVSDMFYGNAGSGTFTAGADVTEIQKLVSRITDSDGNVIFER